MLKPLPPRLPTDAEKPYRSVPPTVSRPTASLRADPMKAAPSPSSGPSSGASQDAAAMTVPVAGHAAPGTLSTLSSSSRNLSSTLIRLPASAAASV